MHVVAEFFMEVALTALAVIIGVGAAGFAMAVVMVAVSCIVDVAVNLWRSLRG